MSTRSNKPEPGDEIAALLREYAPSVEVPPDLEARIRRGFSETPRTRPMSALLWLAAATAVILLLVLNLTKEQTGNPPPVATSPSDAPDEPVLMENPLRHEAMALRRDASRTGRFLLDSLPSLSLAEP